MIRILYYYGLAWNSNQQMSVVLCLQCYRCQWIRLGMRKQALWETRMLCIACNNVFEIWLCNFIEPCSPEKRWIIYIQYIYNVCVQSRTWLTRIFLNNICINVFKCLNITFAENHRASQSLLSSSEFQVFDFTFISMPVLELRIYLYDVVKHFKWPLLPEIMPGKWCMWLTRSLSRLS